MSPELPGTRRWRPIQASLFSGLCCWLSETGADCSVFWVLAVATETLRPYAGKYSPKKFTQPQLFACLVLKTFLKTDYRGVPAHLAAHSA